MDGADSYTDIGLVKRVCKKKLTFTPRRMMTDKVKEKVHILNLRPLKIYLHNTGEFFIMSTRKLFSLVSKPLFRSQSPLHLTSRCSSYFPVNDALFGLTPEQKQVRFFIYLPRSKFLYTTA